MVEKLQIQDFSRSVCYFSPQGTFDLKLSEVGELFMELTI